MGFKIQLSGVKETIRALKEINKEARSELVRAIKVTSDSGLSRVRALTPKKSGLTAKEWFVERGFEDTDDYGKAYVARIDHPYNEPNAKRLSVSTDGTKAVTQLVNDGVFNLVEALEYGTRPHGNHPGTRAHGMVRRTASALERDLPYTANVFIEQVVKKA